MILIFQMQHTRFSSTSNTDISLICTLPLFSGNLQNNDKVDMETRRNVHINHNRIKISSYTPWTWVIIFNHLSTTATIGDTNITYGFMSYSCTFRLVVGHLIEYPFEAFQIIMFLWSFNYSSGSNHLKHYNIISQQKKIEGKNEKH